MVERRFRMYALSDQAAERSDRFENDEKTDKLIYKRNDIICMEPYSLGNGTLFTPCNKKYYYRAMLRTSGHCGKELFLSSENYNKIVKFTKLVLECAKIAGKFERVGGPCTVFHDIFNNHQTIDEILATTTPEAYQAMINFGYVVHNQEEEDVAQSNS